MRRIYLIVAVLFLSGAVTFTGCKKKDTTDAGSAFTIGQSYQGGVVAYVLKSGDPGWDASVAHGIIAATNDVSTSIQWYNGTYIVISTSTTLGTGNANTNAIVNAQAAGNYAAKVCADYSINGYSDWYLPSKDELNKLYVSKSVIGGFAAMAYWSSSQVDSNHAWCQWFSNGNQLSDYQSYTYYVRCIRTF